MADATRISRKTYQWNLLGLGLRDSEGLTRQLAYEAERGLLRNYILYCRDDPVAFMIGAQAPGAIYYYIDVGFDPDYAKWSVGSMLQLKVLRDLFASPGTPALFDFSTGEGEHKARFGNQSRPEANVMLLPKTMRMRATVMAYAWTERLVDGRCGTCSTAWA